jgi:hypothetical protein
MFALAEEFVQLDLLDELREEMFGVFSVRFRGRGLDFFLSLQDTELAFRDLFSQHFV